ncbi:unnamed protein product, partial [Ectocarpus sp. 12 AP-2014]
AAKCSPLFSHAVYLLLNATTVRSTLQQTAPFKKMMPTSGRFSHPDGNLPPPERRRRLDEYGSVEELYSYSSTSGSSTTAGGRGAAGLPVHAQRSHGDIFQELMSRRAHDMISGAQDVVAGAGMIREETQRQNRALRGENDTLRACVDMLLAEAGGGGSTSGGGGGSSGVSPFQASPMQLLSAARGVRDRNHQRELALTAAAATAESALRAERTRREGAEVEARLSREAVSSSREARGRRQSQQQVVGRGHLGEAFSMALRAIKREKAYFMNAVEDRKRAERALADERADRRQAETAARTALQEERTKREQAESLAKCVICSTRRRSRALLPCGHLVMCDRCPVVSTCPICDQQVRRTMPGTLS